MLQLTTCLCEKHAENIIHIVLARLPGAPEGTKGISLFLVPKYLDGATPGTLDSKRNVVCTALEKKMGIHGSATSVMTFEDTCVFRCDCYC